MRLKLTAELSGTLSSLSAGKSHLIQHVRLTVRLGYLIFSVKTGSFLRTNRTLLKGLWKPYMAGCVKFTMWSSQCEPSRPVSAAYC